MAFWLRPRRRRASASTWRSRWSRTTPGKAETVALWRELPRLARRATTPTPCSSPRAREPRTGGPLAFHADFFLVIHAAHASAVRQRRRGHAAVAAASTRRFFDADGRRAAREVVPATRGPSARSPDPAPAGAAVHRRPRLLPAALRRPRGPSSSAPRSTFLLTWGTRAVPSTTATRSACATCPGLPDVEGSRLLPRATTGPAAAPRCSGTTAPNAGFSDRRPGPALPAGRPGARPPDRRRPARRPELHPAPGARADRPAAGHARARRPGTTRGCCTRATRSPTCAAGRTSSSSTRGRSGRASRCRAPQGATVLFGRGVTIEGNDVTVDGFGYAVLALAGRAS